MNSVDAGSSAGRPERGAAAARVEALYAHHSPMVLAVCRAFLRDGVEAEDAAQQTFLSAQRALANGSIPREAAPWLAAIARNECLSRVRARASTPLPSEGESEDSAPDAHAAAVSREQVAELRDALAELPAQQREAILLREVRGFSYDEVAASLAVTTSAVESLIFRARRRLQLTLREAVTAVSPVGWLPLRELLARLAGSGFSSPDLAKVVVVGVGAAAVAGGATVTPQLLRQGPSTPSRTPATHVQPHRSAAPAPPPAAAPAPFTHSLPVIAARPRHDGAETASLVWAPTSSEGEHSRRTGSGEDTKAAGGGTETASRSQQPESSDSREPAESEQQQPEQPQPQQSQTEQSQTQSAGDAAPAALAIPSAGGSDSTVPDAGDSTGD